MKFAEIFVKANEAQGNPNLHIQDTPEIKKKVRSFLMDLTRIVDGKFTEEKPHRGEVMRFKSVGHSGVLIVVLPEVTIALGALGIVSPEVKLELSGNKEFLVDLYNTLKSYKVDVDVSKLNPGGHNLFSVTLP